MNQAPDTFQCRCPLADGSLLTLTDRKSVV